MEMADACFRPQEPNQPPFGKSADGRNVFASFCPSVVQFAHLLTPYLDGKATVAHALPIPKGFTLSLCAANEQLQLSLSDAYARRFTRVFGYIGKIKLNFALSSTRM